MVRLCETSLCKLDGISRAAYTDGVAALERLIYSYISAAYCSNFKLNFEIVGKIGVCLRKTRWSLTINLNLLRVCFRYSTSVKLLYTFATKFVSASKHVSSYVCVYVLILSIGNAVKGTQM